MWPLKPKPKRVVFGGESFEITPLNLKQTIELMLVLAPHLALIENYMPEIKQALAAKNGGNNRPELLRTIFLAMREDMRTLPGDMTKALSILCGVDDPVWLAKNAKPQEFIAALSVLDEVHDFGRLWQGIRGLGVSVGYRV